MFNCTKCELLEVEVKRLQGQNEKLTDKIIALADARAFQSINFDSAKNDPDLFYGGENDEVYGYGDMGQKVLITKKSS